MTDQNSPSPAEHIEHTDATPNPSDRFEINQTMETVDAGSTVIGLVNPDGKPAVVNQKLGTVGPGATVVGMVIDGTLG
jgi:hypothetical protein